MKKQLIISLAILSLIIIGTVAVIMYGSGYRFGIDNGKVGITGTGMLVVTSNPDGAQVFIDDHLTTATDNTINLAPGTYKVKIHKDGYFPWEKTIIIKREVVSKANALLFPTAPKLESITAIGVSNPTLDPSLTRLAYTVSSQTMRKNGIYIMDMTQRPILTLQSASTQLTDETLNKFSEAALRWSPDGKQLLTTISDESESATTYLVNTNGFNEAPQDVTATLPTIEAIWVQEKTEKDQAQITTLKPALKKLITENFSIISWSPDETKVLYVASRSATLPIVITPRHLGVDTTNEQRDIEKDDIYVYDMKEDVNFKIDDGKLKTQPLLWFPDSEHLIHVHDKKIDILGYDGANKTTVYAGPFIDNYVFPWPNGSKLVILTDLGNKDISANLYTISLK